jgi:hypothetical protein
MGARFVVLAPLLSPSLWVLNFGETMKIRVFVINLFLLSFLEYFGFSKFAGDYPIICCQQKRYFNWVRFKCDNHALCAMVH